MREVEERRVRLYLSLAATANMLDVPVVTGDPEFRSLASDTKVLWTTSPASSVTER